jgi:hypothetical protein
LFRWRPKKKSGEGAQISGDDVAKTVVETVGKEDENKDENKDENTSSKSVVDSPTSYIIGIQSNSSFRF